MNTFYKSKKNAAKIRDFLKKYPEAKVYAYEYGIPTGTAQTKGYGNPKEITIILADKSFKTRNSPHIILAEPTYFRADYGTIKGRTAKVRDQYENLAMEIQKAIDKIH